MDKTEIFLEDGIKKTVDCIFYLYNSNYYFLYTENEKDENGYIKLYITKVGKETVKGENGPVETGNMVGIEIQTNDEWKEVQGSISKIVNSKKSKVEDPDIQYLPISMLVNLKVIGKKTFRLLSDIIENDFGISLEQQNPESEVAASSVANEDPNLNKPIEQTSEELVQVNPFVSTDETVQSTESSAEVEPAQGDAIINELNTSIDVNNENEVSNTDTPKVESSFEITTDDSNPIEESEDIDNQDIIIDYRTRFFEEQEKNKKLTEEIEKLNQKLKNIQEIIENN